MLQPVRSPHLRSLRPFRLGSAPPTHRASFLSTHRFRKHHPSRCQVTQNPRGPRRRSSTTGKLRRLRPRSGSPGGADAPSVVPAETGGSVAVSNEQDDVAGAGADGLYQYPTLALTLQHPVSPPPRLHEYLKSPQMPTLQPKHQQQQDDNAAHADYTFDYNDD